MTLERAKNGLFWLSRSDLGILFLLVNIVAMGWYALATKRSFPAGFDVIVIGVFTGKTVHSVAQTIKRRKEQDEEHG